MYLKCNVYKDERTKTKTKTKIHFNSLHHYNNIWLKLNFLDSFFSFFRPQNDDEVAEAYGRSERKSSVIQWHNIPRILLRSAQSEFTLTALLYTTNEIQCVAGRASRISHNAK